MGQLLFADTEQAAAAFDYYANVFVPIGAAILGGIITLLVGWAIPSRTEWYRRLSRWEPYGEYAWKARFDIAVDMIKQTEMMMDAFHAATGKTSTAKAAEHAKTQLNQWQGFGLGFAFLSDKIVTARWEFYHALWNWLDSVTDETTALPDYKPVVRE